MRRFLKPVLVTLGAASAAFLIASGAAPFNGAAAKSVKAKTFCSTTSTFNDDSASARFIPNLPTLPSIPRPNFSIPCIPVPTLPNVTLPTVTLPTVTLPTVTLPTVTLPTIVIPPIPAIGFPGYPTTWQSCSTDAQAALVSCP